MYKGGVENNKRRVEKYAHTIWSWGRAGKQITEDMVRERLREGLVECFDYEEGSAVFSEEEAEHKA